MIAQLYTGVCLVTYTDKVNGEILAVPSLAFLWLVLLRWSKLGSLNRLEWWYSVTTLRFPVLGLPEWRKDLKHGWSSVFQMSQTPNKPTCGQCVSVVFILSICCDSLLTSVFSVSLTLFHCSYQSRKHFPPMILREELNTTVKNIVIITKNWFIADSNY